MTTTHITIPDFHSSRPPTHLRHPKPNASLSARPGTQSRLRKSWRALLVACACAVSLGSSVWAGAPDHYNVGADRLAIAGYDPVAYLTQNKAVKGRPELTTTHDRVVYRFATEENQRLFRSAPEKYRPAYGGWCATAMAKGEKVEIDPTNFKVTNGRLFLFFRAFYANALKDWNKDEANLTTKADANWKRLAGE